MSHPVIEARQLTKFYGKKRGVIDLNLVVWEGETFGYLGPNGAGKSTTIRTMLDLIRPTKGKARIFGQDSRLKGGKMRADVGYLPGELRLYEDMSGEQLLRYFGNIRGQVKWQYVLELANRLDADLSSKVSDMSSGNKQKIGLIQAFMARPRLLILDEPTNGLDPLIQQEFFSLIEEAKENRQTVFVSSHILPVVERICDRVGIIRNGELVALEQVEDLKARAIRSLEIQFSQIPPEEQFKNLPGVEEVSVDGNRLHCKVVGKLDRLMKEAANYEIIDITSHEQTLEQIFLKYYNQQEQVLEGEKNA